VNQSKPPEARDRKVVHLLAVAVVICNSVGNTLLRAGLSSAGPIQTFSPGAYLTAFGDIWVILGILLLIGWLLLQLALLSWADLTYVLPVTSASYVLITILGALVLQEDVSLMHWIAILLIMSGVLIVWRTKPLSPGSGKLSGTHKPGSDES